MRCLVLCLVIVAVAADLGFQEWAEQHGKVYSSWSESQYREQVWTKNLNKILAHNIKHVRGEKGYSMAMNEFGDLTFEEFRRHKTCFGNVGFNASADALGHPPKIHYTGSTYMAPLNYTAPNATDFRKLGYVTHVKNQGQCGSCWAFSTTGSIEGQHFRKTGKLVSLSEQQLVDCSTKFGNDGCDGGLMDWGFTYAMSVAGLETEKSYPYTAEDGDCVFNKAKAVVKIHGFQDIPAGNEDMLVSAIASNGPISVAIDASQDSFQFYSKGVYNEPACSSTELDHGVLAVGYGTLAGKDYYIVKNSWGATWGLDGYILMSRNKKNQCGIATSASYPLI